MSITPETTGEVGLEAAAPENLVEPDLSRHTVIELPDPEAPETWHRAAIDLKEDDEQVVPTLLIHAKTPALNGLKDYFLKGRDPETKAPLNLYACRVGPSWILAREGINRP